MESNGNASDTRGTAERVSGGRVEAVSREVKRMERIVQSFNLKRASRNAL